jgi:hypothetical protein
VNPPRADPATQARVLRTLYLRLMFRARMRGRAVKNVRSPVLAFGVSLLLFAILGVVAAAVPRVTLLAYSSMLHGLTFLLVGLGLATSSGSLLFSPDEADVLLHRPVEPRALLAAKARVLTMVSLALALALNGFGFYRGLSNPQSGWIFLPAHFFSVTLEVVFCTGLVVLAYNLCLRWFGRERLDNVMTALQVSVAILTVAGGQLVPRALPHLEKTVFAHPPAWLGFLPPTWFGALDAVLTTGSTSPGLLALAGLAIVAPVATAWLGLSALADTYAQGLVTLNEAASPSSGKARDRSRRVVAISRLPLLNWWLRDPVERATFRLTLANIGRARAVKLRVYPALGQFLVYPIIMFISLSGTGTAFLEPFALAVGASFLAMIPAMTLDTLRYADDFQAAEIFHCAALARPAAVFHGTRKAVIALLCTPGVVMILVLGAFWLKNRASLLLLLPGLIALPLLSLFPAVNRSYLPFSKPAEVQAHNTNGCLMTMASMSASFIIAGLAALAWTFHYFGWFLAAEIGAVGTLSYFLRRSIERRPLLPPA